MTTAAERLLLESLAASPPPRFELDAAGWEAFWVKARSHSLAPYLHERWSRSGALELLPPGVARRFGEARALNTERNRRIAEDLAEILERLRAAGVEPVVFKGLDLAARCYPCPGLRVLYDVDLLVRPSDRAAALSALGGIGYVPYDASSTDLVWRPREYRWDAEGVFDPERPLFVDLQTRLWEPRWHGFAIESRLDFREDAQSAELDGVAYLAPSDEKLAVELAVHYACNFVESNARLMHLLDLALLIERHAGNLAWRAVEERIRENRAERFCFIALDLARRLTSAPVPGDLLDRLRIAAAPRLASWLRAQGPEAAVAMDPYHRDRGRIYFLHWALARSLGERLGVLGFSLKNSWVSGHFAARTASRIRTLAALRARSAP